MPRRRGKRTEGRRGDAVFAAGHQVVAVGFVPARGDRAVIELSAACPEVAQCDISPLGEGEHPFVVDASEPHARVVGHDDIVGQRHVVPRQPVYLGMAGRAETPLGLPVALHYDRISPVGIILDPGQFPGCRRRIERIAPPDESTCRPPLQIHVAKLGVDPLLEELRTAVLRPPYAPAVHRRAGRDQPRITHRLLGTGTGVEPYETRRTVVIGLEHQQRRVAERQRPLVGRVVSFGHRHERRGAVPGSGQRIPMTFQRVEGLAKKFTDIRAVIFFKRDTGRGQHIGVARTEPRHPVPHVLVVTRIGIRTYLVSQFVMVGDIVAVGSAEPLVDVAAVAAPLVIAPHASHGTVAHRERRLQPAAERRHGGFRHHGIALHRPYRHAQQADSRALLPEDIAQGAYHAAIQVVILHRMAVFVRHELFVPRHGIAVDGRRSEELHTLGQVHHQPVRLKILGVHDEGDAHGAVAEPVRDVGLHGADVKQRAACHTRHGIGIDHPHVGRADRAPLQPRGVGTPRVILRPGFRRDAQGAQEQCGIQQPAHLRSRLFYNGSRPWRGSPQRGRGGRPG